jgi:hypothetical protein
VPDPNRILVGSRSNFGAPLAIGVGRQGSFLSIDPTGPGILRVPPDFAQSGDQASTLGGAVQMFSANSAHWLNGVNNPGASTASYTGVSNPLGLSNNNAFGRLWQANAPFGLKGVGSPSILDPNGLPLKGAPSPDTATPGATWQLFISEPFNNTIAVVNLVVFGTAPNQVFGSASVSRISTPSLRLPVDLAAVHRDADNINWASNTTLDEGSDFYVANRGNNTIVRMTQSGNVVAVRRVVLGDSPLDDLHLNGMGYGHGDPIADRRKRHLHFVAADGARSLRTRVGR